jgi:hypothetical protein
MWSRFGSSNAPAMLDYLGRNAASSHRAYVWGEWDSFDSPIIEGSKMTAIYITVAVGFPESFRFTEKLYPEPLLFVRVIPLTDAEARFREREGPEALETMLDKRGVDLLDLARKSAI